MNLVKNRKIGVIGTGSMGTALVNAWVESGSVPPGNIFVHNRTQRKQEKLAQQFGVVAAKNNEEIIQNCDAIFFCVKPQDFFEMLHPISRLIRPEQIILSLAAGIHLKTLQKWLPDVNNLVRVMPNTPIRIRKGVIGFCLGSKAAAVEPSVRDLLSPLGLVVPVQEGDEFEALTVVCASGTGFVLELMSYWQDWLEEHGFSSGDARRIVTQTFLGTAYLAASDEGHTFVDLIESVASKKGVTQAGLESMREMEVETHLRISFEKAVLRDRELGQAFKG